MIFTNSGFPIKLGITIMNIFYVFSERSRRKHTHRNPLDFDSAQPPDTSLKPRIKTNLFPKALEGNNIVKNDDF